MIIPRITGGIGNQLFIYAAARRLAMKNDTDLVLDSVSGFSYDKDYNRHYQLDHFNISARKATAIERLEPFSRVRRFLKRSWNKKLYIDKRNYIEEEGFNFHSQLLNLRLRNKVYLEGYFQSEKFFKDCEKQIKQDLLIDPPKDIKNINLFNIIKNKTSVAIHIRFFDSSIIKSNTNLQNTSNTSIDYYEKAILKIDEHVPNAHYFIFSDQPKNITNYLKIDNKQMTVINHNNSDTMAYADLWLMSHCKHFIIAKSTFSWWGAWLSNNNSKIIIAPKISQNKCHYWSNETLLPESWIKL